MHSNPILAFYETVTRIHREWAALLADARRLRLPEPAPPGGGTTQPLPARGRRKTAKTRPSSTTMPSTSSNGDSCLTVPLDRLSRPQLALAILREAGTPLSTAEIVDRAAELGADWSRAVGGASNALHGALWRPKKRGIVTKEGDDPWRLILAEQAPKIMGDVALLQAGAGGGRFRTEQRRAALLEVMGAKTRRPSELVELMKVHSEIENYTRALLRGDLDQLIDAEMVKKISVGKYRVVEKDD